MEINKINRGAINSYNAIKRAKTADLEKKSGGKFDSVEIDFSQSLASAKANIASRLAAEANIAKIRQLQEEYAGDSCPVNTESIAEAVLGE
jgi:hypothetical protein